MHGFSIKVSNLEKVADSISIQGSCARLCKIHWGEILGIFIFAYILRMCRTFKKATRKKAAVLVVSKIIC